MKATWLFVFVLVCVVQGQEESLAPFLEAFPYANVDALYELPSEVFVNKDEPATPPSDVYACPSIPVPPDTNNINNLRPGNIRVIMGMGDSITSGMSAKDTNILVLREYRGLAFSMGADSGITTFPNILQPYVPTGSLVGTSTGIGARTSAGNGLNGAVSGAINKDMLSQAQWLVTALKANTKINMATDWKVLTLWIGSNNLCDVCTDDAANNGANFEVSVTSALNYLYANVPRLFVNLVGNLDISTLYNVNTGACGTLHNIACPCVGSSDSAKRAAVSKSAKDYVARGIAIAGNFTARNNPEFAVVFQPFLIQNIITERSLLSAADCFHPSAAGHVLASVALWNNMLTPAAQKKTSWNALDAPICPTADSIFYLN